MDNQASGSRGTRPWFDRLAHDLRSPLTSLQTAAYLLRADPGGSNARELADIVVRQSQRMAKMIEELDDWARAEQHRLVERGERVEIENVLDMAIGSTPGCTLDPVVSDEARGLVVQGDSMRLAQLFRTLIEQCLARDPAGAALRVSRRDGCAVVDVEDRGPALSDEARQALLESSQVPAPDNGLGLRLLIAKAIAEGHAGSLAVDGPDGNVNHRFRCTLPLA